MYLLLNVLLSYLRIKFVVSVLVLFCWNNILLEFIICKGFVDIYILLILNIV